GLDVTSLDGTLLWDDSAMLALPTSSPRATEWLEVTAARGGVSREMLLPMVSTLDDLEVAIGTANDFRSFHPLASQGEGVLRASGSDLGSFGSLCVIGRVGLLPVGHVSPTFTSTDGSLDETGVIDDCALLFVSESSPGLYETDVTVSALGATHTTHVRIE